MRRTPNRVWFFVPVGVLFALDVAFTLAGQPHSYWKGQRQTANEANPIAHPLLVVSPWLFAGLAVVWAAILAVVIVNWNRRACDWSAMLIAFAHALGGSSWLLRSGDWGFALAGGYLLLSSQFSFWCWRRGTAKSPERRR